VRDKLIPAAQLIKGGEGLGFEEQTYGLLYEVVSVNQKTLYDEGIPIYCAYITDSSSEPEQLRNERAIYPTRKGILELLELLDLKELIQEYFVPPGKSYWKEDYKWVSCDLVKKLLQHDVFTNMSYGTNYFKNCKNLSVSGPKKGYETDIYKKQRQIFQDKSKIRIAMIGGLHRTATAVYLYSNIQPTPNSTMSVPRINPQINSNQINENMVINATTALTIITHFDYKEEFIKQLNAYSYRIEKRKTTNIGATFRSVTLLILDSEKHNELEDKDRFPPNTIFTEKASVVSMVNSSFLIFSEFLNFPKFNYSLFFIHSFEGVDPI
jgi:hypothetical protein